MLNEMQQKIMNILVSENAKWESKKTIVEKKAKADKKRQQFSDSELERLYNLQRVLTECC